MKNTPDTPAAQAGPVVIPLNGAEQNGGEPIQPALDLTTIPAAAVQALVQPNAADPDPFDPARFRIRQDFTKTAAVKSELTEITVGKPDKQEFIRVHPDPEYRLDAAIIDFERIIHLVVPELADGALRNHATAVTLFTVQNTQRVTYLWPINLPKDGRANSWTDSARELAMRAMVDTIQIQANHGPKAQRYDMVRPAGRPPEPEWPDLPFNKLLRPAFGDKVITDLDHPVAKRLLGVSF